MFLSRNNVDNVYPCKPQFYYIKVGFEGSKSYRYVFVMHMIFFLFLHENIFCGYFWVEKCAFSGAMEF